MFKGNTRQSASVIEFRRPAHMALRQKLDLLRDEMNGVAMRFSTELGPVSEAALRAEQVAHAIQRLEWALDRTPARS